MYMHLLPSLYLQHQVAAIWVQMTGGVCSFRANPQCALSSTSSRKAKVRPPDILQQRKGYLCKLLHWLTSYPQFSQSPLPSAQLLFIHCSCCSLVGFPHAWPVLLPPKLSSLVAFLLCYFSVWLHSLPHLSPVLIRHPFALQKDSQLLVATCGFFSFFSNTFLPSSVLNHPPTQCQHCS